MSATIAVRKGGKVSIATDSQWTAGGEKHFRFQPKIEQKNGVIISSGPQAGYDLALKSEVFNFIKAEGDSWPVKWSLHCLGADDKTAISRLGSMQRDGALPILIVWKGRIFEAKANGAIFETDDDIRANGAGGNYALGAARALYDRMSSPTTIAKEAIRIACTYSTVCDLPIVCKTMRI